MTKAGPPIMRWALFQAGQIARAHDPQFACVYYREMVHNGKKHIQAMGAVISHLSARVLAVLREDKPYELRDMDGKLGEPPRSEENNHGEIPGAGGNTQGEAAS